MTTVGTKPSQKYACVLCARRKVKCDKIEPCSNCIRSKAECVYQAPAPPQRRKREADGDLLSRINQYEDLLRKHEIPFETMTQPPKDGLLKEISSAEWPPIREKQQHAATAGTSATTESDVQIKNTYTIQSTQKSHWATLSAELRNPPMSRLPPKSDHGQSFASEGPDSESFLLSSLSWSTPLVELHPEPRHIFRLWQIFLENVNPLTKIIHAPTLQQRIFEISWNLQSIPKSTEAVLFTIYTLAIISLSSAQCREMFGEERPVLWQRFRSGSVQALVAAELLTTQDLEVVQAFVLFLLAEPDSDATCTLSAMAVRIGQKMGLHRSSQVSDIPFFQLEMRIRVWWQIRSLDARNARCRSSTVGLPRFPASEFGEVRLPLNVNDSSLHPDMVSPPSEHVGTTEMLYVLLKYEVGHWMKTNVWAKNLLKSERPMKEAKEQAFKALEEMYWEKYLKYCDPKIPLHAVTLDASRLAICRMRLISNHPRKREDSGVELSSDEEDRLFEDCVTLLELDERRSKSPFSQQLLAHMVAKSQLDALIYILSELRYRSEGDLVARAWAVVGGLYAEHPELYTSTMNTFYVALGDLTWEAWACRQRALFGVRDVHTDDSTPSYIQTLASARQPAAGEVHSLTAVTHFGGPLFPPNSTSQLQQGLPSSFNPGLLMPPGFDSDPSEWGFWGDFLQL